MSLVKYVIYAVSCDIDGCTNEYEGSIGDPRAEAWKGARQASWARLPVPLPALDGDHKGFKYTCPEHRGS